MLRFAIEGAAHGCEGLGEWKDVAADQQVVILGSDRMPKDTFCRNRHLGNQVRPCQCNALPSGAPQRNSSDYAIFLAHMMGVNETAEFLGLRVSRHGRRQPHAESFGAGSLDSSQVRAHVPFPRWLS